LVSLQVALDAFEEIDFGFPGTVGEAALSGRIPVNLDVDDDDPNLRFAGDTGARVTVSNVFVLGGEWDITDRLSARAEWANTTAETENPNLVRILYVLTFPMTSMAVPLAITLRRLTLAIVRTIVRLNSAVFRAVLAGLVSLLTVQTGAYSQTCLFRQTWRLSQSHPIVLMSKRMRSMHKLTLTLEWFAVTLVPDMLRPM